MWPPRFVIGDPGRARAREGEELHGLPGGGLAEGLALDAGGGVRVHGSSEAEEERRGARRQRRRRVISCGDPPGAECSRSPTRARDGPSGAKMGRVMSDTAHPDVRGRAGGAAPRGPAREPRRVVGGRSPRAPTRRCGPTAGAASSASTSTCAGSRSRRRCRGRRAPIDPTCRAPGRDRCALNATGEPRVAPPPDVRPSSPVRGGRALHAPPPPPLRGGRRLRDPRRAAREPPLQGHALHRRRPRRPTAGCRPASRRGCSWARTGPSSRGSRATSSPSSAACCGRRRSARSSA